MSLIKLGSISTTLTSNKNPNFYLASVIHSNSGFTYPKLITNVTDLIMYYGTDFRYYSMYKDLLDKGIPIVFTSVQTLESKYNLCSLRLSQDDNFTVSHPALNYFYEYEQPSELLSDDKDIYTYGIVIDLSNVNKVTPNNYITFNGTCKDELSDDHKVIENSNFMIWFYNSNSDVPPVSRTDVKSVIKIQISDFSIDEGLTVDKIALTDSIKYKLNSDTLCTVYNIDDLLIHVQSSDESDNDFIHNGILYDYIMDGIPFSYEDFRIQSSIPTYEEYIDYKSNEYLSELDNYLLDYDYGVIGKSLLCNVVNKIFKENIFLPEYHEFNPEFVFNLFVDNWVNNQVRIDSITKLLIEYNDDPGKKTDLNNLDGFVSEDYYYKTEDKFCSFTQGKRLIEFYSKVKGESGKDICIEIHKVSNTNNYYEITISKNNYQELYLIDLDYIKPINNLTYTNYNNDPEYKEIESLKTSKLVDVYIYDFKVDDNLRIESKDQVDYLDLTEIAKSEGKSIDQVWDEHYDRISELPEGKFYLSRYVVENYNYEDEINSYNLLRDYEYYPDLILVDNLSEFNITESKTIVSELLKLTKDTYSQVLVELNDSLINTYGFNPLPNDQSRMLYFYGDLLLNNISYPTYYPYISNIIDSDFIKRVSDRIIYNSDIDEILLDRLNINYLLYNNLYYNYNRLKESNLDPDFIIRFNTSKITRVFMNNYNKLINCEYSEFDQLVESLIETCTNLLPLVSYLTYDITEDNNTRLIELTVQLESLTNKIFILNINLNL